MSHDYAGCAFEPRSCGFLGGGDGEVEGEGDRRESCERVLSRPSVYPRGEGRGGDGGVACVGAGEQLVLQVGWEER